MCPELLGILPSYTCWGGDGTSVFSEKQNKTVLVNGYHKTEGYIGKSFQDYF